MSTPVEHEPQPRAMRPDCRDARAIAVTSGDGAVTSGVGSIGFWQSAPLIALMLAIVCTLNVLTHLHDAHAAGLRLSPWEPVI